MNEHQEEKYCQCPISKPTTDHNGHQVCKSCGLPVKKNGNFSDEGEA